MLGSSSTLTSKTWLLNGSEEPKDARRSVARRGWVEMRSWTGRSFCAFQKLLAGASGTIAGEHTSSTLPLPLSFTENVYVVSSPVSWSWSRRKAWCGRFAVLPSVAVKIILRLSVAPNATGFERGVRSESLSQLESVHELRRLQ